MGSSDWRPEIKDKIRVALRVGRLRNRRRSRHRAESYPNDHRALFHFSNYGIVRQLFRFA